MTDKSERSIVFEEILSRVQAESRRDPSIVSSAQVLLSASYFEEKKNIVKEARNKLLKEDPRKLYFDCIVDLVELVKTEEKSRKYMWASQLSDLALQGLGIKIDDLAFRGITSENILGGEPDWREIEHHIKENVLGSSFLEKISVPSDSSLWGDEFPLRISACDASQHRFKLRTPFNVNFSSPVVVNNAAGVIKERGAENPKWRYIPVPKNTQDFEDWVVVGFKDYTELSEDDYEWSTKSAMDVGELYVEETYIFHHGGLKYKPDIHLRDGRIFPQDHAMNCKLQNRHGELTREATYRMTTALGRARELGIIYCGVAKYTNLKVYSTIIDWYIRERMGEDSWNITRHVLSDSEVMRRVLYNENFDSTFGEIFISCPIIRSYFTTSNLNRRSTKQVENDLASLENVYHSRDLSARKIVDEALKSSVVMFFAGHSKTPEVYFPRYEFVYTVEDIKTQMMKIMSALRLASFDVDEDHLWGREEPLRTLVPMPTLIAHDLSKKMGEELASDWAAKTNAEFVKMRREHLQTR